MRFYACLKPDEHHASNGWQHARSQKDINKIAKQRQAESSHYYINVSSMKYNSLKIW